MAKIRGSEYIKPGVDTGITCVGATKEASNSFDTINKIRTRYGLPNLNYSSLLTEIAQRRVAQMIENPIFFSHWGADGRRLLNEAVRQFPEAPKGDEYYEILGRDNTSEPVNNLMAAFQKSDGHRQTINWGDARF